MNSADTDLRLSRRRQASLWSLRIVARGGRKSAKYKFESIIVNFEIYINTVGKERRGGGLKYIQSQEVVGLRA